MVVFGDFLGLPKITLLEIVGKISFKINIWRFLCKVFDNVVYKYVQREN